MTNHLPVESIATKIFEIRDKKVMLDKDLAILYGIETKYLTRQVRRNVQRFPDDFMFKLTKEESQEILRCQFVTLEKGKYSKYLPYAFTEQGVAMLSGVLNSQRAIQANILIMRAFIKLKEILLTHKELAAKVEKLESKYVECDEKIKAIFDAIKQLIIPQQADERRILGFTKTK